MLSTSCRFTIKNILSQRSASRTLISHGSYQIADRSLSVKVAVVGSGPAGFYTTQKLLKNEKVEVDIYEKLPVPFGLVRYGVAPDHADVKNVVKSFTSIAKGDRVNFFGNVGLGSDLQIDDLLHAYHAVVLCYGSSQDKLLKIEGEASKNTISARNFVGWYNGLPEDKDLDIDLSCDTACIVGQGNVALDCARILLKPANLAKTDITSYAQRRIEESKIRRIYIIGRRGPVQASFTTKELRELIKLNQNLARIEPQTIFQDHNVNLKALNSMPRHRRRLTELLLDLSTARRKTLDELDGVESVFKFMAKPEKIVANASTGRVEQIELRRTRFASDGDFIDEYARPEDTDEIETINCGLVIRSIGYTAIQVDKHIPMDFRKGAIMNTNGKVQGFRNLYCSGWLATGATGVIAGTLNSSHVTAQTLLQDIEKRDLPNLERVKPGCNEIKTILRAKKVSVVQFNDWLRIDELERQIGEAVGKTREKFVDVNEMLRVATNIQDKAI